MSEDKIIDPTESGATATEQTPASPSTESPDASALQRERDDLYDRLLRKSAEFDNYRAVLDDFDRALSIDAPPEAQSYRAGFELIHRQLGDLLRKRGVTPIEVLGTDFDPHLHQAVAYDEAPGAREGEVIGELRRGYKLGDRLLRPAMVRVAKAS
jgi:molecular chaperone GrpE